VTAIADRPGARRLLGIDIGGTKVALAVADAAGRPLARLRRAIEPSGSWQRDLDRIVADAKRLLREARVRTPERAGGAWVASGEPSAPGAPEDAGVLVAIGISAPGPLDPVAGEIAAPPNLAGWVGVPVRDVVAEALRAPAFLENDANAAALAEWRFGAGRGVDDLVYLTMSTGVGAGVVAAGRLVHGATASAGEIGHTPVVWGGEPCACGLRGCLEAYIGGAAWMRRLRVLAPETSRAVALAGGRDVLTPEHVVAAARTGDAFARAELARYVEFLARALVTLCFTLAPRRIVLGTIPTAAGDALVLDPLRARVRAALWPALAREIEIVASGLGDELPYRAGIGVALEGLRATTPRDPTSAR